MVNLKLSWANLINLFQCKQVLIILLMGIKTPLMWITNHFWWFEILTPWFCFVLFFSRVVVCLFMFSFYEHYVWTWIPMHCKWIHSFEPLNVVFNFVLIIHLYSICKYWVLYFVFCIKAFVQMLSGEILFFILICVFNWLFVNEQFFVNILSCSHVNFAWQWILYQPCVVCWWTTLMPLVVFGFELMFIND
jgi:hypothetical protein